MSNWLEKWRSDDKAVSPERRLMNATVARLAELQIPDPRAPKPAGRLAFVLDLTSSRSASLRMARIATVAMFDAVKTIGSIAVKLIYYRGFACKAGAWENDPALVSQAMQRLSCESGFTQITRALRQVLNEKEAVSGVVFIGDHCEDRAGALRDAAAELGRKGIPVFVFHECEDRDTRSLEAKPLFNHLAEASGGVYVEFRPDSAEVLRELLSSVAAFSAAGIDGMKQVAPATTPEAQRLQGRLLLGPGAPRLRRSADWPETAKRREEDFDAHSSPGM